jgi:simple sugar transport system ATP-binding protein
VTDIAPSDTRPPALRLDAVTKRFGDVVANDHVSLTVARGEVHALLGENGAGKSTLMNVVYGLLQPDGGTIEIDGRPAEVGSPREALDLRIGMVHQHFKLVVDMTVAENVALSLGGMSLTRLDLGEVRARTTEMSERFGLLVDPDAVIEDLSVGEQQRVEILKLLLGGADLLILDEPTAVLAPPEWADLAQVLRGLVAEGRSIVFISHKLDEVFDIATRCTVLRDGRVVGTRLVGETDKAELAKLMVGREVVLRVTRERVAPGPPVLEVEHLSVKGGAHHVVSDVSFTLRGGEVLGVAGVDGNGQSELVAALTGMAEREAGEIRLLGEPAGEGRALAVDERLGVIPEDRHRDGVALDLSVADNLMLKDFDRRPFARRGIRSHARTREHCAALVADFDIRVSSLDTPLAEVSGGNQQKVVLARELAREPHLLIATQPTRGLDVGAMEFVYGRLAEFKRRGGATLLISTELEEVMSLSDRIAVMVNGRFVAILPCEEATLDVLGPLMASTRIASPTPAAA